MLSAAITLKPIKGKETEVCRVCVSCISPKEKRKREGAGTAAQQLLLPVLLLLLNPKERKSWKCYMVWSRKRERERERRMKEKIVAFAHEPEKEKETDVFVHVDCSKPRECVLLHAWLPDKRKETEGFEGVLCVCVSWHKPREKRVWVLCGCDVCCTRRKDERQMAEMR